jgi:hypothetical protein
MAITNAQQYQQLVNKPANGKRPGYRGDAAYGKTSGSAQAKSFSKATSRDSAPSRNDYQGSTGPSLGDGKASGTSVRYDPDTALAAAKAQGAFDKENPIEKAFSFIDNTYGRSLYNRFPNNPKNELDFLRSLPASQRALLSPALRAKLETIEDEAKFDDYTTAGQKFTFDEFRDLTEFNDGAFAEYAAKFKGAPGLKYSGNVGNLEKYVTKRDAEGRPLEYGYKEKMGGDGDGMSDYERRLLALEQSMSPTTEPEVDPNSLQGMLANRTAYRFMADGGMTNDAPVEGGIMDLESGRQMYFLGKLVKKATRAVKKIAKSPIGIAALTSFIPFGKTKSSLFSRFMGTGLGKTVGGFFGDMDKADKIKLALGAGLTAAPLLFQEEEEEPDYASNRGPGLDIEAIRANPYNTMGSSYRFFAEGGDVEPVAKKTMPLLDMDGKEMDLRKDGGFVPIGRMERADDVPARLSKNEFVFTADAVRNAGDGDIDKGAEVMYNMMKNLESGGEVSEESQGLDGAREMFQTSQRLEEVL